LAAIPRLDDLWRHNRAALPADPATSEEDEGNGKHGQNLPEPRSTMAYDRPGNQQDSRCSRNKDWEEPPLRVDRCCLKHATHDKGKRHRAHRGHDKRSHADKFAAVGAAAGFALAQTHRRSADSNPPGYGTSRRSPSRFDPRVGRVIFVQPYGGVVLGRGVGVEPPITDLHDGSVADSAAFLHANSIGAPGWCRPAERSDQGRPIPALLR
jgi:hypothetical protein